MVGPSIYIVSAILVWQTRVGQRDWVIFSCKYSHGDCHAQVDLYNFSLLPAVSMVVPPFLVHIFFLRYRARCAVYFTF